MLVSDVQKTIDFAVCAPDVNFSDHLPLVTVIKGDVCVDDDVYLCSVYVERNLCNYSYAGTKATRRHITNTLVNF